jgi:hypothetical protein
MPSSGYDRLNAVPRHAFTARPIGRARAYATSHHCEGEMAR